MKLIANSRDSILRRLLLFRFALLLVVTLALVSPAISQTRKAIPIAATPPMGWNSWDAYGRTLDEKSIKASARWMAEHLKRFGWEYVVVDEGWYLANLNTDGNDNRARFQMDTFGRYVPVPSRFPSAGKNFTFKPLADYL